MRKHRTHLTSPTAAAAALALALALSVTPGLGGCGPATSPARPAPPRAVELDHPTGLIPLWSSTTSPAPRPRPGCRPVTGNPAKWSMPVASVRLQGPDGALGAAAQRCIRRCIRLQAGSPYAQHRVRADTHCIFGLGQVKDVWVEGCKVPGGIAVTYVVQGEPRVRRIQIQVRHPSHRRWHRRSVYKLWRPQKNRRLSRSGLRYDLKELRAAYRERGYWSARLRPYIRRLGAGWVDLVLRIRTGPRVFVGRVTIQGNRAVAAGALRKIMRTQPGGIYRAHELERDLLRIQQHYYNRGFINVRVHGPKVVLSADKRLLNISIRIQEKNRFGMGRITLAGPLLRQRANGKTVLSKDPQSPDYQRARRQLQKMIKSRSGQRFSRSLLAADIQRVTAWYKDHGHLYAEVVPETNIDLARRRVHLTLKVNPGERVAVQKVRVQGHRKVPETIIRSLLDLGPRDRCDLAKMRRSHRRLLETGLFGYVTISTQRGQAKDLVILKVIVVER